MNSTPVNATQKGLACLPTIVESARQTVLLLRHSRLWWVVAAVALLLGASTYVLGGRTQDRLDGRTLFCLVAWWLQATVLVPWTTIYLGVQAVHGRLEDRTFQFLFLRPVGRMPLLLGNWLAVAVVGALVACLSVVALFLGVASRRELWPDGVQWHLLAVFIEVSCVAAMAYAAVAVLFAAYFRRPMVWAAFFVVGLQMLAANLPVSAGLRRLTITDPLRRMVLDGVEPDRRLALDLWPAESDFRPEMIGEPVRDLGLLSLVCLCLALWTYSRTEYDSRSRE